MTYSIILPCYNAEKTIPRALESIQKQTFQDFEIIVIDDGSADATRDLVETFFRRNPAINSQYIFQRNAGPASARNVGLEHAMGDYVAFLDADDIWHPQKLEISLEIIKQYGFMFIGHDYTLSDDFEHYSIDVIKYPRILEKKTFWNLLLKNFAVTPSIVIKRDRALTFNSTMRYIEDHDLWLRLSQRAPFYFVHLPLVCLGRKPMSSGGLSENRWAMRFGEMRMYWNIGRYRPLLSIFSPFLILFSLFKHVKNLFKR